MAPIGISKFTEDGWAYTGIFGSLFKLTKSLWEFAVATLKRIGHIVVKVAETALDIVEGVVKSVK